MLNELSPDAPPRVAYWPIRIIGLLLVGQAIGAGVIVAYLAQRIDWEREFADVAPSLEAIEIGAFVLLFTPLAIALPLTALALVFRWRVAWVAAMLEQGLLLFFCLAFYLESATFLQSALWLYAGMFYSVLMVLYLNTADVRLAFLARPAPADPRDNPESRQAEQSERRSSAERGDDRATF
jgi:hypothetical protein